MRHQNFEGHHYIRDLPTCLRGELAWCVHSQDLVRVSVLKGAKEAFLRELATFLEPHVYLPGDQIVPFGYSLSEMFFVKTGLVGVYTQELTAEANHSLSHSPLVEH